MTDDQVPEDQAAEDVSNDVDDEPRPEHAAAVLDHIARSLVDVPDEVRVDIDDKGRRTQVNLRVADGDMGRIIGREGRTVKAIRSLLFFAGQKHGKRYHLDIVD